MNWSITNIMKINKTKDSFEKKKKIGGMNTFLIILLTYAFLLPILLIFGIELQKQIIEINFDLLINCLV